MMTIDPIASEPQEELLLTRLADGGPFKHVLDPALRGKLDENRTATLSYEARAMVERALPRHPQVKGWLDSMDHCEILAVDKRTFTDKFKRPGESIITAFSEELSAIQHTYGRNFIDAVHDIYVKYEHLGRPFETYGDVLLNIDTLDESDKRVLSVRYEWDRHKEDIFAIDDTMRVMLKEGLNRYQDVSNAKAAFEEENAMLQAAVQGKIR